jgi:hypothetical protein
MLMRAVGAARDMTAKRRGSTALNRTHDFELVQADVPHCPAVVCLQTMRGGVCGTPDSTIVLKARLWRDCTEDIRDLQ